MLGKVQTQTLMSRQTKYVTVSAKTVLIGTTFVILRVLGVIEQFGKGIKDTLNFNYLIKVFKN